ncbi:MAG: aminoglycoside 6'-N-acetyltransferase [Acidobacteriota bacterium]
MLIRAVTKDDLEEWIGLRGSLWPECSEEEHRAEIEDYFNHTDKLQTFVAQESGRLVGFLEASLRPFVEDCLSQQVGYIEGWYVDLDHRLKGVGAMLVRAAEEWARSKGCGEMASDCEITNEVSLAAHLRLRYEETSRLIHFRKNL